MKYCSVIKIDNSLKESLIHSDSNNFVSEIDIISSILPVSIDVERNALPCSIDVAFDPIIDCSIYVHHGYIRDKERLYSNVEVYEYGHGFEDLKSSAIVNNFSKFNSIIDVEFGKVEIILFSDINVRMGSKSNFKSAIKVNSLIDVNENKSSLLFNSSIDVIGYFKHEDLLSTIDIDNFSSFNSSVTINVHSPLLSSSVYVNNFKKLKTSIDVIGYEEIGANVGAMPFVAEITPRKDFYHDFIVFTNKKNYKDFNAEIDTYSINKCEIEVKNEYIRSEIEVINSSFVPTVGQWQSPFYPYDWFWEDKSFDAFVDVIMDKTTFIFSEIDIVAFKNIFAEIDVQRYEQYWLLPSEIDVMKNNSFNAELSVDNPRQKSFISEIEVISGYLKSEIDVVRIYYGSKLFSEIDIEAVDNFEDLDSTIRVFHTIDYDYFDFDSSVNIYVDNTEPLYTELNVVADPFIREFYSEIDIHNKSIGYSPLYADMNILNPFKLIFWKFKSEVHVDNFSKLNAEIHVHHLISDVNAVQKHLMQKFKNQCAYTKYSKYLTISFVKMYWGSQYIDYEHFSGYDQEILTWLIDNGSRYYNLIRWENVDFNILSEEWIKKYKDFIDWTYASKRIYNFIYEDVKDLLFEYELNDLSEEWMLEHFDELDWDLISLKTNLSEDFVKNCIFLNKNYLAINYYVDSVDNSIIYTEKLIELHPFDPPVYNPKLPIWDMISMECKLSVEYIRKNWNYLNLDLVYMNQYLDSETISILGENVFSDVYQHIDVSTNGWLFAKYQFLDLEGRERFTPVYNFITSNYQIPQKNYGKDDLTNLWIKYEHFCIGYMDYNEILGTIGKSKYFTVKPNKYNDCNHKQCPWISSCKKITNPTKDNSNPCGHAFKSSYCKSKSSLYCKYKKDYCDYCLDCSSRTTCSYKNYTCYNMCNKANKYCKYCYNCDYFLKYNDQAYIMHGDPTGREEFGFNVYALSNNIANRYDYLKVIVLYSDIMSVRGNSLIVRKIYI